jgi:hypothetical protein
MKKKIIIYLSIIIVAIAAAIILIVVFTNNKKDDSIHEISIDGYGYHFDDAVELNFGKHKVKEFIKEQNDGEQYYVDFEIKSGDDFYNDYIKNDTSYNPELDFYVEGCEHYGYLIKDDNIFQYKVWENGINISASYGVYLDYSTEGIKTYYILGNFSANIFIDRNDSSKLVRPYTYSKVSYDEYIKIYNYIDEDICKIEDGVVYLKAICYDKKTKEKYLTDNYFVTISNIDGKATLSLI